MEATLQFIPSGGVTAPRGFLAGATAAGIKHEGTTRLDLAMLRSVKPCAAAGVFTTNKVKAAPLLLTQKRLEKGRATALVVNSGIANACNGPDGMAAAIAMGEKAAGHIGAAPEEVLVASTGVIGWKMPMERIGAGIGRLELSPEGGHDFARAIMTTDTIPKEAAVRVGGDYVIGGVAKGSGMIHPDMATLLGFLTTDAALDTDFLRRALKEAVDVSFNMVTVDGDTSTNDMVLLMANGQAGGKKITGGSPEAAVFQRALNEVCVRLAKAIARDGEGATRLIEVNVTGAAGTEDARRVARTVAGSPLVKTAVHGCDSNWGRLLAAAGRCGAALEPDRVDIYLGSLKLAENGCAAPFNHDEAAGLMGGGEVMIKIDLKLGGGEATAWGCDLSGEYVTINSEYTT
jgi:glutamate N-acetyltransferase/amino-acid N-acetyltransferase